MKNKKGFTLVEILSIITVLGIIVMLVLPNLGGSIDEKKENELNKSEQKSCIFNCQKQLNSQNQ